MRMKNWIALISALLLCMAAAGAAAQTVAVISGSSVSAVNGSYETLQEALTVVSQKNLGNVTVKLEAVTFSDGDVTLAQSSGTHVTLVGQKGTVIKNQLKVKGSSSSSVALTIKNIVFDATDSSAAYVFGNGDKNSNLNNVTVDGCTFMDSAKDKNMVSIRGRSAMGSWIVKNTKFDGMGSVVYVNAGSPSVMLDHVTVTDVHTGVNALSVPAITVKDSNFKTSGSVIRYNLDGNGTNIKMIDNNIDSPAPLQFGNAGRAGQMYTAEITGNSFAILLSEKEKTVLYTNNATPEMVTITPEDLASENTYLQEPKPEKKPNPKDDPDLSDMPKTGDASSLLLWVGMMAAAIVCAATVYKRRMD